MNARACERDARAQLMPHLALLVVCRSWRPSLPNTKGKTMTEPTEAMAAAAAAWALVYRAAARKREEESRRKHGRELEPGWEAFFVNDAWEAEGLAKEAFEAGMAQAAELIGVMVKAQEDDPRFVISVSKVLKDWPLLGERRQRAAARWEAKLAEAKKNAPPPMSERIANGEWLDAVTGMTIEGKGPHPWAEFPAAASRGVGDGIGGGLVFSEIAVEPETALIIGEDDGERGLTVHVPRGAFDPLMDKVEIWTEGELLATYGGKGRDDG